MIYKTGRTRWGPDDSRNDYFEEILAAVLSISGTILDVGCGKNKVTDSVVGVDPFAIDDGINVRAYMWDMPYEDNSVDGIVTFHAMEHISKYQVMPALREFTRVLKPGHPMIIVVPDLLWVLQDFITSCEGQIDDEMLHNLMEWKIDTIFGIQTHEGEYHRTGFTTQFFEKYFSVIPDAEIYQILNVIGYNQWNLAVLARKKDSSVSVTGEMLNQLPSQQS